MDEVVDIIVVVITQTTSTTAHAHTPTVTVKVLHCVDVVVFAGDKHIRLLLSVVQCFVLLSGMMIEVT